jgi:NAD-dependent oxidoreductase involved in siderophore biosynthesis
MTDTTTPNPQPAGGAPLSLMWSPDGNTYGAVQIGAFRPEQIRTFSFHAPGADEPAVTLHMDTGQVELGPGYTPDAAAGVFWDAVQRMAQQKAFGAPLAATIDQHLQAGQKAEQQVRRLDAMAQAWAEQLPETIRTATVADAVHTVTRPNGERP